MAGVSKCSYFENSGASTVIEIFFALQKKLRRNLLGWSLSPTVQEEMAEQAIEIVDKQWPKAQELTP